MVTMHDSLGNWSQKQEIEEEDEALQALQVLCGCQKIVMTQVTGREKKKEANGAEGTEGEGENVVLQ